MCFILQQDRLCGRRRRPVWCPALRIVVRQGAAYRLTRTPRFNTAGGAGRVRNASCMESTGRTTRSARHPGSSPYWDSRSVRAALAVMMSATRSICAAVDR